MVFGPYANKCFTRSSSSESFYDFFPQRCQKAMGILNDFACISTSSQDALFQGQRMKTMLRNSERTPGRSLLVYCFDFRKQPSVPWGEHLQALLLPWPCCLCQRTTGNSGISFRLFPLRPAVAYFLEKSHVTTKPCLWRKIFFLPRFFGLCTTWPSKGGGRFHLKYKGQYCAILKLTSSKAKTH